MKKIIAFVLLIFCFGLLSAQSDSARIGQMFSRQLAAWNSGDIEGFMKGYWESDSLAFIGKSGVVYGYRNMLDTYKKGYPDTVQMGKLQFDILQMKPLPGETYFVIGKWTLRRTIGDLQGHFSLILRKIRGEWLIVADHSS